MVKNNMKIGERLLIPGGAPYVIAEAGSNFDQDLDKAHRLIDVAADAGADAVKFQLFNANALYPPGTEMNEIFKSVELNPSWLPALFTHAKSRKLEFIASCFDFGSLEALEKLGVSAHKVASSETTNHRLLAAIARTGKPMFIATGMCDLSDIDDAVNICHGAGNSNFVLMQCGSVYPLAPAQANLRVMSTLAAAFGCMIGWSDHTLGPAVSIAAVALGASVIERHFTLDKHAKGPDHFYAMEPEELKRHISDLHDAYQALGTGVKSLLPDERAYGRRDGLYLASALDAGVIIEAGHIVVKRPALGMRARHLPLALGARTKHALTADQPLNFSDIDL